MDSGTLIILAIATITILVVALVLVRLFSKPSKRHIEKAQNFLESLRENLYKSMVDIVVKYDYRKFDNIADLEMDIVYTLTEYGKKEIEQKVLDELFDNHMPNLIAKAITDDMISKFVNSIIDKLNIEESIQQSLSDIFKNSCKDNEKLEEEITNQFSSEDFFTDEEVDENTELENDIQPSEEELAQLNPPREDGEEPYNPDDESMELIEDEEENTVDVLQEIKEEIYIDANGRARNKAGKFVKKPKEE